MVKRLLIYQIISIKTKNIKKNNMKTIISIMHYSQLRQTQRLL